MRENKMKKIRIAAAGDNCMDVYDKENKAFPGGNPVNVAVYVARLGGEAAYIGPVGTDAYGKQMMDAIQGKGVDVSRLKILEGTTAVTHVEIVDGDRVLGDYEEGVMADFQLDEEEIDYFPFDINETVEPVYVELPGWQTDMTKMQSEDEFPEEFNAYLSFLEEQLGVPIKIVSLGPDREQTIERYTEE